jgi:hypothetical protein
MTIEAVAKSVSVFKVPSTGLAVIDREVIIGVVVDRGTPEDY